MKSMNNIEASIRKAIAQVVNITDIDGDIYLVSRDLGIFPADFIYIFDIIENDVGLPVYSIFEGNNYEVMTINNLVRAIYELQCTT